MCKIEFVYPSGKFSINNNEILPTIRKDIRLIFEEEMNEKLSQFCERINKDGGKISVMVTNFGNNFDWVLITPSKAIEAEVMAYLNSI